jgi:hypothetical protein
MKNKYYTPAIDEFYVGFEYEVAEIKSADLITGEQEHKIWVHKFYDQGDLIDLYYNYKPDFDSVTFDKTKLRVKYLDQKDIESLGFKETETMNFFELDNKQESYLNWYPETNRVEIGDNECSGGFSGTIKNKSELVKLLKQLGINE